MESFDKTVFKYLLSHSPSAVAQINGGSQFPTIAGFVQFFALDDGVIVIAQVENLPKTATNVFAFHIHEGQSCEDDFAQSGGHFNPQNLSHPSHAGDLPPLFSNDGLAWQVFFTERVKIEDILGRVLIVHDSPDDFTSQPSGNSGQKIACGKIVALVQKSSLFRR